MIKNTFDSLQSNEFAKAFSRVCSTRLNKWLHIIFFACYLISIFNILELIYSSKKMYNFLNIIKCNIYNL